MRLAAPQHEPDGGAVIGLDAPAVSQATDEVEAESARVVERADLLDATYELAAQITANSPFGMALTKQVVQQNVDAPSLEAAVAAENLCQVLASRTEDMVEALAAFREKRSPVYRNR